MPESRILVYGQDIAPEEVHALQPIGVSGSREFPNLGLVGRWVRDRSPGDALIVGDASGVDTVVASVAEAMGGLTVVIVPFRTNAGKIGGLLRNPDVVRHATHVVCFWDGDADHIGSTGTSHAGFWALLFLKPLTIYSADGWWYSVKAPSCGQNGYLATGQPEAATATAQKISSALGQPASASASPPGTPATAALGASLPPTTTGRNLRPSGTLRGDPRRTDSGGHRPHLRPAALPFV